MIFQLSDRRRDVIRYAPPVLTYENQPSAGIDTFLDFGATTTNYGTNANLWSSSGGGRLKTLWKDPFTGLSNIEVLSAKLSLYIVNSNNGTINFYALLRDWIESQATYNIWKTANNWTTPGALSDGNDKEAAAMATSNFSNSESSGDEHIIDLSISKVEAWINGTQANYGLIAISSSGMFTFGASDNANATIRPKITVKYFQK